MTFSIQLLETPCWRGCHVSAEGSPAGLLAARQLLCAKCGRVFRGGSGCRLPDACRPLRSRGPALEPFVVTSLIQLLCRMTKLCWFDDDAFRSVVEDAKRFLEKGLQVWGGVC
jgi:hypothetical protein